MAEAKDTIEKAKKNLKSDQEYWSKIYSKAKEDAHFLSDDEYAQWTEQDFQARVSTRRPALTIDQLGQFVHQVANDIRINTPTINVIPTGEESDQETAEVFKGLIKNIEYASNADNAYDTAALNAIKTSIGFIRVDHDYVDDESFDQELLIKRVVNPLACWLDRSSTEIDGRDAKRGTIIEKITVAEFKAQYPDFEPVCFESEENANKKDDDMISIAEVFEIDETSKVIAIDQMGNITDYQKGMDVRRTRTVKSRIVRRYKMSGADILEETTFPGKYIPLVPVYGEENWIDGERNIMSLIRKSKDAQRMFNYWKSLETELLQKAPQAPVMAAEGQVEEYADDWLNPGKAMVLRYKTKDITGQPLPPPQRLEPPTIPTGIVNAARQTVDDIKATMGIYNASLGQRSNEQSGVAIAQRKQEGDVATFHFSDNLMKSVCQVGRVLVNAIPEVYDTPRILQIIGMEEEPKTIGVNGAMVEDQEEPIDLRKGKYDVKVVTGANYTTLRQEAMAALQTTFQAAPELMNVMGDLYFKNADFAGAQAMAERMKKVIDPKFLEEEGEEQAPQVDPEKQQMLMALQQLQQENAALQEQLKSKQDETMLKAQSNQTSAQAEQSKLEIQAIQLRLEENKAKQDAVIKLRELELKERELEIKEAEIVLAAQASMAQEQSEPNEPANEMGNIMNDYIETDY